MKTSLPSSPKPMYFIWFLLGGVFIALFLGSMLFGRFYSRNTTRNLSYDELVDEAGIAEHGRDETQAIENDLEASSSALLTVDALRGYLAPDFTLQDLNGQTVSLSDYQGQPVMLNFWATWCPPCIQEMPLMQEAYELYEEAGLVILAINATDTEASESDVHAFVEREGFTYPVLLDLKFDIGYLYYIDAYPISFFIDAQGVIQRIQYGSMTRAELFANLEGLLEN